MFQNAFKIAWRQIGKNKLYSFVNITGLTVGIASCLLIGIYILNESSYDRFHKYADRIVRVTMDYDAGDAVTKTALTGTKVGPQFKRSFPEVEDFVRTFKYTRVVKFGNNTFEEKQFLYADAPFFTMFSYPLVKGNPSEALNAPDKIVVTQSMAKKYFGSQDPMGKTLQVGTKSFIISGIAKTAPLNSQIQFDFVAPFNALGASKKEAWWEANYVTYLLLRPNVNVSQLQNHITAYMRQVGVEELKLPPNNYLTYHLEPLASVHLYSPLPGFEPNTSVTYIYILAAVGLLILLIASVNYTNLATAQSASRTGEIGIRKVMGALNGQVFRQFMTESALISFISLALSLALAYFLLPYFNQLSGKSIEPKSLIQPSTIALLGIIGIAVTISSGTYPALMLSNLKIISILKSGFSFTGRGNQLRKSLIVLQFVISVFLIICTLIVVQQLQYIRQKDLGYNKEHVLVLPLDNTMQNGYENLKEEMLTQPGVKYVTAAYEPPVNIEWGDGISKSESDKQGITVNAIPVDKDFTKAMGLRIIAGTDFTDADVKAIDTSDNYAHLQYSYMLNESAVRALGWTPEEAIGKTIYKGTPGKVKAVVKDFHFHSFHSPITPLVIFLDERMAQQMLVKIEGRNVGLTLHRLESLWKQKVQHRPFEYHFLDEDYAALYKTEERTAGIFTTFASLAIFLACLGLFALTSFSIVQRTKEIGIRKILGANVKDLLTLLSKDFLFLVIIGILIASPIAWYASNKWLEDFSYRIHIQWWLFVLAGAIAILIALITISILALKAAVANPVQSLRTQ